VKAKTFFLFLLFFHVSKFIGASVLSHTKYSKICNKILYD